MQPLSEVQYSLRKFILGDPANASVLRTITSPFPVADVLTLHRNNFRFTLAEALASTFPAVQNLLGEDCFLAVAGEFAGKHPPASPILSAYGNRYPEFLDAHPALSGLPYLGDVARLEWAWNGSFHAADVPILTPEELRWVASHCQEEVALTLHPSVRLLASNNPAFAIWQMARCPGEKIEEIDLVAGPEYLLVLRPYNEVQVTRLDVGTYKMLSALRDGCSFNEAAEIALRVSPDFSPDGSLGGALARGALASFNIQRKEEKDD